MSEKLPTTPPPVNEMTYAELLAAQEKLRQKGRPTIPYIPMESGYSVAMEMVGLLRQYGLEGNPNIGLGGVTIFIDSEADFKNLQKFIQEHSHEVRLPRL